MTGEYTPSTEAVRRHYAMALADTFNPTLSEAAFDRWLSGHDAGVLEGVAVKIDGNGELMAPASAYANRLRTMAAELRGEG
jgi:hypothetical protein